LHINHIQLSLQPAVSVCWIIICI